MRRGESGGLPAWASGTPSLLSGAHSLDRPHGFRTSQNKGFAIAKLQGHAVGRGHLPLRRLGAARRGCLLTAHGASVCHPATGLQEGLCAVRTNPVLFVLFWKKPK